MLAVGTRIKHTRIMVRVLVFYATFNNISVTCISWRSVLLVEETRRKPTICQKFKHPREKACSICFKVKCSVFIRSFTILSKILLNIVKQTGWIWKVLYVSLEEFRQLFGSEIQKSYLVTRIDPIWLKLVYRQKQRQKKKKKDVAYIKLVTLVLQSLKWVMMPRTLNW